MKILLAVDGSDYTRRMLDYVTGNKALFDASHSYTVFNAQPALPPHVRSSLGAGAANTYHEDEARQVLEPALNALRGQGLNVTGEYKVGQIGETIAEYARDNGYDMIIMGSHGHGALGRLVLGSVSTQALAKCDVPVLLVR